MLSQAQYHPRSDYAFELPSPTSLDQSSRLDGSSDQHGTSWPRQPAPFPPGLSNIDHSDDEGGDDILPSPTEAAAGARSAGGVRKNSTNTTVRKRTSRACDSCNQLRTKCDGKHPCTHCTDTGLNCEYARVPKKRGKVSKKDLARQAALREKATAEAIRAHNDTSSNGTVCETNASVYQDGPNGLTQPTSQPRQLGNPVSDQYVAQSSPNPNSHGGSGITQLGRPISSDGQPLPVGTPNMDTAYQGIDLNSFGAIAGPVISGESPSLGDFRTPVLDFSNLYMGMGGLPGQALPIEAMEFSMNSPSAGTSISGAQQFPPHVKHPVLLPLFPFISKIMQPSLAFELLEHFFTSSSSEYPHPASPYHITTVFRKKSFLGQERPRRCSPALLASMLWSAAWTSDARALTSPPSARARMCQKLLSLCIFLLNPLVHGDRIGKSMPDAERNGVSRAHPMGVQEMLTDDDVPIKIASGTVDDVVTYMHIAIVVSASEDKGASLRWWTAAWNLAKELKLGRELEVDARTGRPESFFLQSERQHLGSDRGAGTSGNGGVGAGTDDMNIDGSGGNGRDMMCEEEREERRRVWWTLYLVDRHLSLCYNRHLTLLDSECSSLLRPMDEMAWQEGVFDVHLQSQYGWSSPQRAGRFDFTAPSTFGYFLPISTILGEIIDLHQRRMHPFLAQQNSASGDLTGYDAEVRAICHQQLETFQKSMHEYRDRYLPPGSTGKRGGGGNGGGGGKHANGGSVSSVNSNRSRNGTDVAQKGQPQHQQAHLNEEQFQIATACAYGEHLTHVMYILLYDRWDPATLLADDDLWFGTDAFRDAMQHAVSGADAVADILRYDPQVGFMPYLYGIYLLQGSFLLLAMADKLGTAADGQMIAACETIVRAHEACVVTLNTEYQRAFRRCMQSALAQVRGRMPRDAAEQQRRRRETLSLYRWLGDGGGLAV